jgi:NAD(P) transhydrogenase
MEQPAYDYDLLVIGSGPGGQKAAIGAAKLGKRVCVVERRHMVGGVCVNTGTIPSKTLREAVLHLTGLSMREVYGQSYRVKHEITVEDLLARTQHVIGREVEVVRAQLLRNHVDLVIGTGRFDDAHTVVVEGDREHHRLSADKVVIATGTQPARPPQVEFDDHRVVDSDGILALDRIPDTMVVVGAGVIGIEYASMFAALGTRVTVVEKRDRMLEFCDPEVVESLKFHLRDLSVSFRFGEEVDKVEVGRQGTITTLVSGKRIPADTVMYSAGRQGMTVELNLAAAGLAADDRGRLTVDDEYRTPVPHIFAVGDVIGFPALAATSMDQGRLAALYAFGEPANELHDIQPIGIYTVPEISYVGQTEVELTGESVPYEVGIARRLLGVHVFGTGATDLVHIGQAVMGCGGTVDYLVDTVFNFPTLSEAYKVAALDVTNKLRAVARFDL